mmetsp:Transcript_13369/g.43260  ORF Transcript_13369/g.43260 Transcript_13369/m.43260 type:complete len:273 (+) Transcript_13369:142-960(+)
MPFPAWQAGELARSWSKAGYTTCSALKFLQPRLKEPLELALRWLSRPPLAAELEEGRIEVDPDLHCPRVALELHASDIVRVKGVDTDGDLIRVALLLGLVLVLVLLLALARACGLHLEVRDRLNHCLLPVLVQALVECLPKLPLVLVQLGLARRSRCHRKEDVGVRAAEAVPLAPGLHLSVVLGALRDGRVHNAGAAWAQAHSPQGGERRSEHLVTLEVTREQQCECALVGEDVQVLLVDGGLRDTQLVGALPLPRLLLLRNGRPATGARQR